MVKVMFALAYYYYRNVKDMLTLMQLQLRLMGRAFHWVWVTACL